VDHHQRKFHVLTQDHLGTTVAVAVDVDGNSSSTATAFTFDVGNEGLGYDVGWILRPQSGDSEAPSEAIGHGFAVELERSVVIILLDLLYLIVEALNDKGISLRLMNLQGDILILIPFP
jgi:hypothetical protein